MLMPRLGDLLFFPRTLSLESTSCADSGPPVADNGSNDISFRPSNGKLRPAADISKLLSAGPRAWEHNAELFKRTRPAVGTEVVVEAEKKCDEASRSPNGLAPVHMFRARAAQKWRELHAAFTTLSVLRGPTCRVLMSCLGWLGSG